MLGKLPSRLRLHDLPLGIEQASHHAAIVESSADLIVGVDLAGTVLSWNRGAAQLTGFTEEEMVGRPLQTVVPPEHWEEIPATLARVARDGAVRSFESSLLRQDGGSIPIAVTVSPFTDSGGEIVGASVVARDLTELVYTQERLRLLESVMEQAQDSIVITDVTLPPHGPHIVYANPSFCTLCGQEREKLAGLPMRQLPSSLSNALLAGLERTDGADEVSCHEEIELVCPDGSRIEIERRVTPILDGEGRISHFVNALREITERKHIERLLRQARSEWTATVDTVSDLIVLEDSNGCVLRCNQATANFFEVDFSHIIGRPVIDLFFPGEKRAGLLSLLRDRLAVMQFPGRPEWYEVSNYPLAIRLERGASWVHILKDVTARRTAERMTHRLLAAISQAAEAIVILDRNGVIEYANPALTEITGLTEGAVIGRPLRTLPLGPSDRGVRREIVRTLAVGHVWQGTYMARRHDGQAYEEEAAISPVRDGGGRMLNFVAVCRDVTERKRLEAIAEAVNTMDNVGYVFSNLRHELGNPINSIKTALSVLRRNLEHYPLSTVAEYLDRTLAEVGRVEYLLKVLRSFNMYENPKVERGDLLRFLADFCILIRADFASHGIALATHFDPHLGEALFDPRALHQVLLNLATNAADALADSAAPVLTLRARPSPRSVIITVGDNGAGMTAEQQSNLFRPFYTGKPHGTGLGLAIVKKLVTRMGGTVEITSRPGLGTEATVTLSAAPSGSEHTT